MAPRPQPPVPTPPIVILSTAKDLALREARFFAALRMTNSMPSPSHYAARNAVATGSRAALIAGNRPPNTPMKQAQMMPEISRCGVTVR